MDCLQLLRINKSWKIMAATIFFTTLNKMSIFRSLEIGFSDRPHNGYVEFGDPPIKG